MMRQSLRIPALFSPIVVSALLWACGEAPHGSTLATEGVLASEHTSEQLGVYRWTMTDDGDVVGYAADGVSQVASFHVDYDTSDDNALLVTSEQGTPASTKIRVVSEQGHVYVQPSPYLLAERFVSMEPSALGELVRAFNSDARVLQAKKRRLIGACGAESYYGELEIDSQGYYWYMIDPPQASMNRNKANVYVYMKGGGSGNDLKIYNGIQLRAFYRLGTTNGSFDGVHFIFDRSGGDPRCTSRP
jgi:hypothetical protein